MDPREPLIEYKWCDVGVLDYDESTKLYYVQKVNKKGRVIDDQGNTVINGGILEDGIVHWCRLFIALLCSYLLIHSISHSIIYVFI